MKKSKRQLNQRLLAMYVVSLLVIGFGLGFAAKAVLPKNYTPESLVWVADETVKAPESLLQYLEKSTKDDCRDYQGTDSVRGVALTAVYQVVHDQYAKVALGCSTNLDDAFPVIKTKQGWKLLSAASYYVPIDRPVAEDGPSSYPRCSIIDKYKISQAFEPQCLDDKNKETPSLDETHIRQVTYP